jgi:hypothetical protein
MPLPPMLGKTVGPYQILAKLGEGGMGARGRASEWNESSPRSAGVGRLRAEGASASWAEALAEARPRATS